MAVGEDVKAHIDALNLGVSTFIGPVRPANPPAIPHRSIFVLEHSGLPPTPYMDGSTTAWRRCRVNIRLRSNPHEYQTTRDNANTVWSAFQQSTSVTNSWVRVTCDQSLPMYLGQDAFQCHEWTVNVTLEKEF
jgi:hypothetical protein